MKHLLFIIFLLQSLSISLKAQDAQLEIIAPKSSREPLIDLYVEDAVGDFFKIKNGTISPNLFIPTIASHHQTDNRAALIFMASVSPTNDLDNGQPVMAFDSRIKSGSTYGPINNRNLFTWNTHSQAKMVMSAEGFLGIGTSVPESKLQITDGDIFIEDINHGVIMKSPNSTCYRITVDNNGSLVSAQITCPN